MTDYDRRDFLRLGGLGILGVAFAPLLGSCRENPTGPPSDRSGFAPFITPADQFFQQYGGRDTIAGWSMPDFDRDTWRLDVIGEVATPLTLSWADVQAAASAGQERSVLKTIQCILDSPRHAGVTGLAGNAWWTGIPLRYFLDRAGMDLDLTKRVIFTGADSFTNNVKFSRVSGGDQGAMEILLVYRMNGVDLTREHGGPVRLIIPEMYGYKNIKWLTAIEASPFDRPVGQYQREGFTDDGVIRVNSRTVNVKGTVDLPAGRIEITGFAVSGYEGISSVQVSVDGGAFESATIEPATTMFEGAAVPESVRQITDGTAWPFPTVWAPWRFEWEARAGGHVVAVRATDRSGRSQPDQDLDLSDGQNGVARYSVRVV